MAPITPGEDQQIEVVVGRLLTEEEESEGTADKRTDVAQLTDGKLMLVTEMTKLTRAELAELIEDEAHTGAMILTSERHPEQVQNITGQIRAKKAAWRRRQEVMMRRRLSRLVVEPITQAEFAREVADQASNVMQTRQGVFLRVDWLMEPSSAVLASAQAEHPERIITDPELIAEIFDHFRE